MPASRGPVTVLERWTRFVPAVVWILWALHTIMLERQLSDRKGSPIESLPMFLVEVVASYAALFVYGWLVALVLPRNRFLATAISAGFLALYALLLLYHWHTRGQFEWAVLWRFRREMLDLEVRRTISSFLGWRSYAFPVFAVGTALVLEAAGRAMSRPPRPRLRWLAAAGAALGAAFLAFGPLPTRDELSASLRALEGNWRLTRMMPDLRSTERYPYARRSLVSGVGPAPARPPHVFFILIESFNANFVEARTGDGREYTPFFDSLIPRGLYVERFYGNSMESPRGQLATLCSVLPAMRGAVFEMYRGIHLRCLPEILDERGYRTVFDEAARLLKFEDTGTFMETIGFQVRRAALEPERERPADAVWHWGLQDDVFFREFFEFLDADRARGEPGAGKPVFATLCTISSHFPDNQIPPEKRLLFPGAQGGKAGYGNSIYLADTYLRAFFEELGRRPELADSLIVIEGDHSYPAGEHGLADSQFGAWEEVFRTPLLILWNGHLAPRRIRGERWSQLDIAPTVLDLLGIDTPNHFMGRSILRGWDPKRDRVHLVQPFDGVHLAAIAGNLKYVLHVASGRESVYDLSRDPHEDVDLIARYRGTPELDDLRREVGKMLRAEKATDENRLWPPPRGNRKS
jgi:hypothetical protein